jgi:hypothetical protein
MTSMKRDVKLTNFEGQNKMQAKETTESLELREKYLNFLDAIYY